jgi:uncharacterized protein YjbJ (UPF0337 family)
VADDRSPSGTEAPWWQDPGRVPAPAPEEPETHERAAPPPPAELTWFERREPFLKALSARIEPVEEVAGRAATELRDLRSELREFAEDTGRTLADLAARVSQQHTDAAGRADALRGQLVEETEKLTSAIGDEVRTTAEAMAIGVQDAAGKATDAAGKATDAALGRMDRAEETLRARISDVDRSLRARLDEIDKASQERVGKPSTLSGPAWTPLPPTRTPSRFARRSRHRPALFARRWARPVTSWREASPRRPRPCGRDRCGKDSG